MRSAGTRFNYGWLTPSLSSENELRGRSQTVGSMIRGRRDSSTFRGGGDKKDLRPPVQTFSALFKILLWPLRLYHGLDHPAGNAWQNTAFCRWPGRFQYNNSRSSSNVTHEVFLVFSDSLCCQLTFLRQTDSEFCQREIKMAGRWKKLSSCLRPRWKRLSSQLLLLLVTSCGQRPVSGYSTVSHHFSPSNG